MRIVRSADRPTVPASHEDPRNPGVYKKVLLQKADLQTGTIQMVNWAQLPVGKSFAAHYHEDMQEVFIMLAGTARIQVGDESAVLNRGDAIVINAQRSIGCGTRGMSR